MSNDAQPAHLLSDPAESPSTGLAQLTPPGIERPPRTNAVPGDLMRLFVAIAPPPAVLDELDALLEPLRERREDLRWTSREAWHVTLAFLGQVDERTAAKLPARLERAAGGTGTSTWLSPGPAPSRWPGGPTCSGAAWLATARR